MSSHLNSRCVVLPASETQIAHFGEPFLAFGAAAFDRADQAFPDGSDTAEAEYVPLQALQAVGPEVPAIEERRHAHGDDDAGALSRQEFLPHLAFPGLWYGESR